MAAKAATATDEEMRSSITCQICYEHMRDARTLYPCMHTFCIECILQLCQTSERPAGIRCPLCRTYVTLDAICRHPLLNQLIAHHIRKEIGEDVKYCSKHPKKKLKMNCKTCSKAICSKCKFEEHDTHESETFEQALNTSNYNRVLPSQFDGSKPLTRLSEFPLGGLCPMRFCHFKGALWLPKDTCTKCIKVYSLSGKLQRNVIINSTKVKYIFSVCKYTDATMLIATDGGLIEIDENGRCLYTFPEGSGTFKDVCVSNEHIVANCGRDSIHVWRRSGKQPPQLLMSIQIPDVTSIIILQNQIIASCDDSDSEQVKVFDVTGLHLASYGFSGRKDIGEFTNPRLTLIDWDSNLLIADVGNQRFQLLDIKTGRFSGVQSCPNGLKPKDAVVVGKTLYVLGTGHIYSFAL